MHYEELQNEVAKLLRSYGEDAVLGAIAVHLESNPSTAHLAEQLDDMRLIQPQSMQQACATAA